jgi:hypothetical protein
MFCVDRVDDRLPRDVVAYFDTEMSFIERRPEPQRFPTLLAIAAAAHRNYTNNLSRISLVELEDCICLAQITCLNLDYPRSVEDVYTAANGWLTNPKTRNREVDICCKPPFTLYAQEDYNSSLAWARRQINSSVGRESGAVISQQHENMIPSLGIPDFLGGTFDTLASDTLLPTPLGSIDNGLGISELKGKLDAPLFLSIGEELVLSPPRQNSTEDLVKTSLNVSLEKDFSKATPQTNTALHVSPRRMCDFCISMILESGASSGQYHVSLDSARAAMHHCTFCTLLYANIYIVDGPANGEDWPLYHWTLRALPRGRELKGSMMLRFWSPCPLLATKSFRCLPGAALHVPSPEDLYGSTDPKDNGEPRSKDGWTPACKTTKAAARLGMINVPTPTSCLHDLLMLRLEMTTSSV